MFGRLIKIMSLELVIIIGSVGNSNAMDTSPAEELLRFEAIVGEKQLPPIPVFVRELNDWRVTAKSPRPKKRLRLVTPYKRSVTHMPSRSSTRNFQELRVAAHQLVKNLTIAIPCESIVEGIPMQPLMQESIRRKYEKEEALQREISSLFTGHIHQEAVVKQSSDMILSPVQQDPTKDMK